MSRHDSASQNSINAAALVDPSAVTSKTCAVCRDVATCNNFGALTCESCKSFFRRHGHRSGEFHCPGNNTCTISKMTSKYCTSCRLRKCIEAGMKRPTAIRAHCAPTKKQPAKQRKKAMTFPLIHKYQQKFVWSKRIELTPIYHLRAEASMLMLILNGIHATNTTN